MKNKKWLVALLAILLALGASIGTASAYFTTYSTAKGGYVIHLGHEVDIHEEYGQQKKIVSIENKEKAAPVFVRVQGFSGSQYPLKYSGENWEPDPNKEGFWRYKLPVPGGESTGELTIEITDIPADLVKDDSFNVIVVCESVPVIYDENGDANIDASWKVGEVKVIGGNGS